MLVRRAVRKTGDGVLKILRMEVFRVLVNGKKKLVKDIGAGESLEKESC